MQKSQLTKILALPLEEKILNIGALIALSGIFCPWISGKWLGGEMKLHTGFGFYTSFLGVTIFILLLVIILITITPIVSKKQFIQENYKNTVRFFCSFANLIIVLCSITVLMKVTWDFQGLGLRYGLYTTLIGSLMCILYAGVLYIQERRTVLQNFFHQNENIQNFAQDIDYKPESEQMVQTRPEPLAPPAPKPENHFIRH